MQNKNAEITFFNKFGNSGYDVFEEETYTKLINVFWNLIHPKENEKIVDFGCGTGAFISRLQKWSEKKNVYLEFTGVDISPKCISYAQTLFKNINFVLGDIEDTKFPDNSFDIVIFFCVLHHFNDFSKCVKEAFRIQKQGGRVFIFEPNKKNPIMWLYRDKKSPLYSNKGITVNERLLTVDEIRDIFTKVGYKIKLFAISGITYKYVEGKLALNLLPIYNLFEKIFDKVYLSHKYGSFIIGHGEK